MTDPATGQRSFLQALKVPFDLKGVVLGAMAFVVLILVGREIGGSWTPWSAAIDFLGNGRTPAGGFDKGEFWKMAALHLGVAAVFGVACCRIAAVRLARDEGVDLSAALGFSIGNFGATLGAVVFLAAAAGFFYACNALAGLVSGIAGVGPFLMIVLFPLAILSTLVLFLIVFGSAFGFPLTLASLAVERNGSLDAVSRGFSYVFSRPALFFFYGLTVWFLAAVLMTCALGMEGLLSWSFTNWFPEGGGSHFELKEALAIALGAAQSLKMPEFGGGFAGIGKVEGAAVLGGWVAWIGLLAFHLALMGWVVYYAFGGATAAYFALRRDVDGTEEEELWIEGEDAERFNEPERPAAPSAAAPAAAPPLVPAPPSSSPPAGTAPKA